MTRRQETERSEAYMGKLYGDRQMGTYLYIYRIPSPVSQRTENKIRRKILKYTMRDRQTVRQDDRYIDVRKIQIENFELYIKSCGQIQIFREIKMDEYKYMNK